MAQSINLLPRITEDQARKEVYKKKINVTSIAALLAVALIFLSLFAYQLFLQTSRSRVDRQSQNIEEEISSQKEKEISQRALIDKLDQIDSLLGSAIPNASAVANISDIAKKSGNISIGNVSIQSDGDVTFGGVATDSKKIEKLIKELISSEERGIFGAITLQNLSREEDEPYNFTINMDFLLKGLKSNEN